jgi:glycerol-3-phosphate O-acyltransferase / dihydroxyacetone phosphate acyltransferase
LARNGAVGIFPEGGSHDRPEMLPLKAGVAIMALETLKKFPGTKLKIVPTGLHYFNADKVILTSEN